MQEVQALCDRVIVINKGEIVADDLVSNLLKDTSGQAVVIVEFERDVDLNDLKRIKGVDAVQELINHRYKITSKEGFDIRPEIFRFAADKNLSLVGLKQEENSLENIFQALTSESAKNQ
jgi:ABC-2 type transport system ATP-binding protein